MKSTTNQQSYLLEDIHLFGNIQNTKFWPENHTLVFMLKTILNKIIGRILFTYKVYFIRDEQMRAVHQFYKDRGASNARLKYELNPDSIVFDVGGYIGDWAAQIFNLYNCHIFIFEPVREYYDIAVERFKGNSKIKIFNFGLGGESGIFELSKNELGSSIHLQNGEKKELVIIEDVVSFLEKNNISQIDLLKINIEGSEFELLKKMVVANKTILCKDIQVQFHSFYPNAKVLRHELWKDLENTHYLTYNYPFFWENWHRK